MTDISILDELPDISILDDEEITFDGTYNEMVSDYEEKYEELFGEKLTIYPTDERGIELSVISGKFYQIAAIMDDRFRQNFIKYMQGAHTVNWGANFGFFDDGLAYASVTLRFSLSEIQSTDVVIPEGTRATAGDNVFFATGIEAVVPAGETGAEVEAVCTEGGISGNGYAAGQINILADPVSFISGVVNVNASGGGRDTYTNDERKTKIINFPKTYSTAGPEDGYEMLAMSYSPEIIDARCLTDKESAEIYIYILTSEKVEQSEDYRKMVEDYIVQAKNMPGTDRITVRFPEMVPYTLEGTYYIHEDRKDIEDDIREMMQAATDEFIEDTASKIGRSVNPDTLVCYAMAAGAARITIASPAYRRIEENQIAVCTGTAISYGGLVTE